jgi:UDP-glucose 4-epimerase
MTNVLVTGGAGFIGRNLIPRLLAHGFSVRVLDCVPHPFPGKWRDAAYVEGDVLDQSALGRAIEGADVVVHLAARGSVVESIDNPAPNFDVNVRGTLQILQEAVRSRVDKFLFASTGGALIGNATPPVNEDSLPKPLSPYGASKLCGEAYCHAFAQSYGLHTVTLRFANVYGPGSDEKQGAVTSFIKALSQDQPIKIFGSGSASRDYLYVDDLCHGIIAAISGNTSAGDVFHLASGLETTVLQLAHRLIDVSGKQGVQIQHLEARAGEVERNFASFARASERLGFRPRVTLREGLTRTWDWFQVQARTELTGALIK